MVIVTESGVWKWEGGTRKTGLTGAFHERRTREFCGESVGPPFPQKKKWIWDWWRWKFPLSWGRTCTLQSHFSPYPITFSIPPTPPTLTISTQIWTNNKTHIFKKLGGTYPSLSPPVVTVKTVTVMRWYVHDEVNQEESEQLVTLWRHLRVHEISMVQTCRHRKRFVEQNGPASTANTMLKSLNKICKGRQ